MTAIDFARARVPMAGALNWALAASAAMLLYATLTISGRARRREVVSPSPVSIAPMSDESIADRIERLVAEEHELRRREEADSQSDDALETDRGRLQAVEVELDRCWDLLRQRRALRRAGGDPDDAQVRDAETVEHYQQ